MNGTVNANINFSRYAVYMMYAVIIALCSECVGHDRLNLHFQSRWYMRRSVNSLYISN